MASLFSILFLISLVFLVWGLVAPHHLSKTSRIGALNTRKHYGLTFGVLALVFCVLVGMTTPTQPKPTTLNVASTKNQQTQSKPTVTTKQVTSTVSIPFTTQTQDDSSLARGQTKVTQTGQNGVETDIYSVTYTNGKQTSKTLVFKTITTQPVNEIVVDGTYVAPAPAPTPTTVTTPSTTSTPSTCYPQTDGGNCYEPGEYCRDSDQGTTGVAGDGETITCENNDGWRWEPN